MHDTYRTHGRRLEACKGSNAPITPLECTVLRGGLTEVEKRFIVANV